MTVMTEQPVTADPVEERRGGAHPDWGRTRPGEELPELEPDDPRCRLEDDDDDRDAAPLLHWCGLKGCGGD